jgi:hypothetical protein
MSQRQVNLKSRDVAADTVRSVEQVTAGGLAGIKSLAARQEAQRKETEKALLLGSAQTDELIDSYTKLTMGAQEQMQVQLNNYIASEARIIGQLKTDAYKPGATQADKDAYFARKTQGTNNLNAIATVAVEIGNNENIPLRHVNAVSSGASANRLTKEALENTEFWQFQSSLGSGQYKDLLIKNDNNGQVNISAIGTGGSEGIKVNINAAAFNDALLRTGETSKDQVISDSEVINQRGTDWFKEFETTLKDIPNVLEGEDIVTSTWDASTNKKTVIKSTGATNIKNTLLEPQNFQTLMQYPNRAGFNKTWDQLGINGLLKDSKYKDISWNTFNNKNIDQALKKLNDNYKQFADLDPTKESQSTMRGTEFKDKITKEDYLQIQQEMKDESVTGLAQLAEDILGNKDQTVVSSQELDNYYKNTDKNSKKIFNTYTSKPLKVSYPQYKKGVNFAKNTTFTNPNGEFAGLVAEVKNDPEFFNIDTKNGFEAATGKEIKALFPGTSFGNMRDDVLYQFNKTNPQKYKTVANPDYLEFKDGKFADEESTKYFYNIIGVDDYTQDVYQDPASMKELNLEIISQPLY